MSDSYVKRLIRSGGPRYSVTSRDEKTYSFKPISSKDQDVKNFQATARELDQNAGNGYKITNTHKNSESATGGLNIVLIELID
jgi:hypothetical protein